MNDAFFKCSSLTSIVPNSVTTIGFSAFFECNSLKYNEYGNCLYLGNEENLYLVLVKAKYTSIKEATISSNIRFFINGAFSKCSSLTSIVIPTSVTSIGSYAFYNCSSLTSIVVPNSVKYIGDDAFKNCKKLKIYCEANSEKIGWAFDWNKNGLDVYWGYKSN